MSPLNLSDIPKEVDRTEKTFVWFIQVVRGSWFRRLVFLLVGFLAFANPTLVTAGLIFLGANLPAWYLVAYWAAAGLLLLAALFVGFRTVPKERDIGGTDGKTHAVRGLLPFNFEDSDLFGKLERGIELQRVLAALHDPNFRFGILVGVSGSGKTSFLRAGILPQLCVSKIPAAYVELSSEDPLASIARETKQQGQMAPPGILLLDQFEQFFLHQRKAEARKPLIDALKKWYLRDSGIRVLISIRAEDAWQMIEIQESVGYELSNRNHLKLPKFDSDQALNVLKILCESAGIKFDSSFAHETIAKELPDSDGLISPVNLGIVLLALASRRIAFTAGSLKAHGGIAGLLEEWLNTQLEAAKFQNLERAVIQTLTALCDFDHDRRSGMLTVDAIAAYLNDYSARPQIETSIKWLSRSDVRLVISIEKTDPAAYQLSHERFIPAIRKVAGKVLDAAARANGLLERRVREWVSNTRSPRFLLTPSETLQINRQRPYLLWGGNREDKEDLLKKSQRRLQWRGVSVAVALLLVLAGYVAWSSNFVQRYYTEGELRRLAKSYPTENVAFALAALGDLPAAVEVARRGRAFYADDSGTDKALSKVSVEAAKTALARQNRILLTQAVDLAMSLKGETPRVEGLTSISEELAKAGRFDDATKLADALGDKRLDVLASISLELAKADKLDDAYKLADTLEDNRLDALASIGKELAKGGKLDEARKLAETLGDKRASVFSVISLELAKAGKLDEARKLAEALGDKRAGALALLSIELAKAGQFDKARSLAGALGVDRANSERKINVEMAKQARLANNEKLLGQAKEMSDSLDWTNRSIELWQIAILVRDHDRAEKLLNQALTEIIMENQQGHGLVTEVLEIPQTMSKVACVLKDWNLLEQAREQAVNLDPLLRGAALEQIAEDVARVWGAAKARGVLGEAATQPEGLGSKEYSAAEGMAKLGYLKRARELAESAGCRGELELANAIAAVVLADVRRLRLPYE